MGILMSMTRQILFLLPLIVIFPRFFGIDGVMYAGEGQRVVHRDLHQRHRELVKAGSRPQCGDRPHTVPARPKQPPGDPHRAEPREIGDYLTAAAVVTAISTAAFLCFQIFPRQIVAIFGEGSEAYFHFADRLSEDGRQRRARNPHVQPEDEQRIEDRVQERT